jgi:hypothetical protein
MYDERAEDEYVYLVENEGAVCGNTVLTPKDASGIDK